MTLKIKEQGICNAQGCFQTSTYFSHNLDLGQVISKLVVYIVYILLYLVVLSWHKAGGGGGGEWSCDLI